MRTDIFHPDFKPEPYWWEAYRPATGELAEVPREVRVAIVGGGYAGLATAIELRKHGIEAVVIEAERARDWRQHAQWRRRSAAGSISARASAARATESIPSARTACCTMPPTRSALIERMIAEEASNAFGRSAAASSAPGHRSTTPSHAKRVASLNDAAQSGSYMVPRERQREEIASDYYYGGMVVERSASCTRRSTTRACSMPCGAADHDLRRSPGQYDRRQWHGMACRDRPRRDRGRRGRDRDQRLYRRRRHRGCAAASFRSPATSSRPRSCRRISRHR